MAATVTCVLISYDIACQWSRNLAKRVRAFPLSMQEVFLRILILFAVPKFHLPAHGSKCQSPYNLGFIEGAGRVDGEGIERGWSLMNSIATATREMGPGFRHDTMDDHWQSLNWRKIVSLGEHERRMQVMAILNRVTGPTLLRKFNEAVKMAAKQTTIFESLSATFTSDEIASMYAMVEAWKLDKLNAPDPYTDTTPTQSLADVRRELAKEEEEQLRSRSTVHETPVSVFISKGLELEDSK